MEESPSVTKSDFSPEQEIELNRLRDAYKSAVEEWISVIREEEALATANHTEQAVEVWDRSHLKEEDARTNAKKARQAYQDGLRQVLFHF